MASEVVKKRVKRLVVGLGVFQILLGLSAVAGGVGMVGDPSGDSVGFPLDQLSGTPFPDYLIPGLFLLLIIGVGHLAGGILTIIRFRHAGEVAVVLGAILMAWIVVQVILIGLVYFLQPLYFLFAVVEILLGRRLHAYMGE